MAGFFLGSKERSSVFTSFLAHSFKAGVVSAGVEVNAVSSKSIVVKLRPQLYTAFVEENLGKSFRFLITYRPLATFRDCSEALSGVGGGGRTRAAETK